MMNRTASVNERSTAMTNARMIRLSLSISLMAGIVPWGAAGEPALKQETALAMVSPEAGQQPVPTRAKKGMPVDVPCLVYENATDNYGEKLFFPSGWMGTPYATTFDDSWTDNPHSPGTCIKVTFSDRDGWGGVAWQHPENNWGDSEGGVDLTGATHLSFWARGETGKERVDFKMGIVARDKRAPFYDTAKAHESVKLGKEWKRFVIPLKAKNLTRIITPFAFVVEGDKHPVTFYIDDIVYE